MSEVSDDAARRPTRTYRSLIVDLILGTFRLEGARLFWSMMTRLQLESHPIVCWKFCYVMHRVLRDGHKHVGCIRLTADRVPPCDAWVCRLIIIEDLVPATLTSSLPELE